MVELLERLPEGGAWTILALFLTLIFGAPAIFSEEGAKRFWLIRKIHSWVKNKEERSIEKEMRYEELQARNFSRRLLELEESHKEDRQRWKERFDDLENEFRSEREKWIASENRLQRELQNRVDYVEYLISWIRKTRLASEEYGWKPNLEKFYHYEEWLTLRREGLAEG